MRVPITLTLLVVASSTLIAQGDSTRLLARARAIHRAVPMIDTHNDLPGVLRDVAGTDPAKMNPEQSLPTIDTDFSRMKAGMIGGQLWSAYLPASLVRGGGATDALEQIDVIKRIVAQSPSLGFARTRTLRRSCVVVTPTQVGKIVVTTCCA